MNFKTKACVRFSQNILSMVGTINMTSSFGFNEFSRITETFVLLSFTATHIRPDFIRLKGLVVGRKTPGDFPGVFCGNFGVNFREVWVGSDTWETG